MRYPTQADVARLAGVSRTTVSFVVNGQSGGRVPISEETHKRVLAAIDELGYVPDTRAKALRSGDTNTIGLVIPDIHNPYFWEIADGVDQEAMQRDTTYSSQTYPRRAHRPMTSSRT
jgi:LacI family transcriptional regulator